MYMAPLFDDYGGGGWYTPPAEYGIGQFFGGYYEPSAFVTSPAQTGSGGIGGFPVMIGASGQPGGGIRIGVGGGSGAPKPPSTSQTLTQIVNTLEVYLQQNLGNWKSGSVSADDAVRQAWIWMDRMVSDCLRFGAEGEKAAAERDRRINPARLRWDWIGYYIDPITGGNTVPPPPPSVPTSGGTAIPGGGMTPTGSYPTMTGGFRMGEGIVWIALGAVLILLAMRKE